MRLPNLIFGTLLGRRKRYLADVRLADGTEVVAWCPNPGRMTGCMGPGWPVALSHDARPGRKLAWTWELAGAPTGTWVLVNTQRPNQLAAEALAAGLPGHLKPWPHARREVRVADGTRLDFVLGGGHLPEHFVEVKGVSLVLAGGVAAFPDAVTARGTRHLDALAHAVQQGIPATLLFVVTRPDAVEVRPATHVDPVYTSALRRASSLGVTLAAVGVRADVEAGVIMAECELPVHLHDPVDLRLVHEV